MGEVGVGQGFGLVSEQEPDVAGLGLLPQQVETETGARDRLGILAADQGVTWPAPGEAPFCRSRMLSREGEMATSDRRRISALSRGRVQTVRRPRLGSPGHRPRPRHRGRRAVRCAAATAARRPRPPKRAAPVAHRSARTPSARRSSPSCPVSVHKIARARSASPRATDRDRTPSAATAPPSQPTPNAAPCSTITLTHSDIT